MKLISIFHPFTPSAVGIPEGNIPKYHSRPHVKALERLSQDGYKCQLEYFSDQLLPYTVKGDRVCWKFWPVSKRWHSDSKKWKKQWSYPALLFNHLKPADVTIINMSGHSSPFSFRLADILITKNKQYIAMLGGQHLTLDNKRIRYYQRAHHILVHTKQQKESMEKLPEFKNCTINIFPLGVDCERFQPSGNKTTGPNLLYVGRIIEWKRIHLAIEALDLLHNNGFERAMLTIVGPTSSEIYLAQLKQLITDKGLENKVLFKGFVEYDNLLSFYQDSDLFMLPSDHETFGMVMIESMACGVPVAGIDCPGGPKEVITHGHNGILTNVEDYSNAILNVFQNPNLMDDLKLGARKTAVEKYGTDASYNALKNSVLTACKRQERVS